MKKLALITALMTFFFLSGNRIGLTDSVTYQITMTIPAIPGVNVPPFNEPEKIIEEQKKLNMQTVKEELFINNQKVVRITITEK